MSVPAPTHAIGVHEEKFHTNEFQNNIALSLPRVSVVHLGLFLISDEVWWRELK